MQGRLADDVAAAGHGRPAASGLFASDEESGEDSSFSTAGGSPRSRGTQGAQLSLLPPIEDIAQPKPKQKSFFAKVFGSKDKKAGLTSPNGGASPKSDEDRAAVRARRQREQEALIAKEKAEKGIISPPGSPTTAGSAPAALGMFGAPAPAPARRPTTAGPAGGGGGIGMGGGGGGGGGNAIERLQAKKSAIGAYGSGAGQSVATPVSRPATAGARLGSASSGMVGGIGSGARLGSGGRSGIGAGGSSRLGTGGGLDYSKLGGASSRGIAIHASELESDDDIN